AAVPGHAPVGLVEEEALHGITTQRDRQTGAYGGGSGPQRADVASERVQEIKTSVESDICLPRFKVDGVVEHQPGERLTVPLVARLGRRGAKDGRDGPSRERGDDGVECASSNRSTHNTHARGGKFRRLNEGLAGEISQD